MLRAAALAVLMAAPASAEERTEIALLPGFAYSTDTGLGLGAVGSLARVGGEVTPYRWRLQAQLFASAKADPFEVVTHDHYVDLDVPGLAGGALRARGRLAFNRNIAVGWYGLGNDSQVGPDDRFDSYRRLQVVAETLERLRLAGRLEAYGGLRASFTDVDAYPGSRLEMDRDQLAGVEDHGSLVVSGGLLLDTRDHEAAPSRGLLAEIGARAGVGPEVWAGATASLRGFVPLVGPRLVLATRLLGDALAGDPPFDELARHGGMSPGDTTGGGASLRGIPGQRYHGHVKLLGNTELRLRMVPFRIGGERFILGVLGFVDAGRVWDDEDGDGLGLHVGAGGGLRLEWGTTFVVRADLAASPEGTSGFYIDVGQVF